MDSDSPSLPLPRALLMPRRPGRTELRTPTFSWHPSLIPLATLTCCPGLRRAPRRWPWCPGPKKAPAIPHRRMASRRNISPRPRTIIPEPPLGLPRLIVDVVVLLSALRLPPTVGRLPSSKTTTTGRTRYTEHRHRARPATTDAWSL